MKKNFIKLIFAFASISVFFFTSCTEEDHEPSIVTGLTFDSETFYANKAKWEECKPQNYEFSYELLKPVTGREVYFERGIRVTSVVKNGEWESFKYETESGEVSFNSLGDDEKQTLELHCFKTIDDYISYIEENVEYENKSDKSFFEHFEVIRYEYVIHYNDQYFFPYKADYMIEYKHPEYVVTDSAYFSGIIDFKVLPAEQVK